jgi:hypothetical protein
MPSRRAVGVSLYNMMLSLCAIEKVLEIKV